MFQFFANYGYHSRIQVDLSPPRGLEDTHAWRFDMTLIELQDILSSEMAWSQEYQEEMAKQTTGPRVSGLAYW